MILIDRIVAVIISAMIVLMGFMVQQRAQQTSLGSTMLYVGKKQTLELADMLERDLANIGFNRNPGQTSVTAFTQHSDGMLDSLIFWGIGRDSIGATARQVEVLYRLIPADTVNFGTEAVPLYALQRFEREGGGAWSLDGGSPPTLSRFYVDLLGETNNSVTPEQARRVRVWLENAVMPEANMGEMMNHLRLLRWSMTLSPSNLRGFQGG